jgi:SAM-dependent methyltransferase
MNKNIFQNGEGDCYFNRNISIYENDEFILNDIITKNIQNIINPSGVFRKLKTRENSKDFSYPADQHPEQALLGSAEKLNILEIGCSSGFRLNTLNNLFPNNNYFGFDPSKDAIDYAKQNYSNINFEILTCDDINLYEDKKFDIIMIPLS